MTTTRELARHDQPPPRDTGTRPRGAYRHDPQRESFQLMFTGGALLLVGGLALLVQRAWGIGGSDVVAVMALPGGVVFLVIGLVCWRRRPLVDTEVERALAEWPGLERMLLATERRHRARALAERGYGTSTARRAILRLFARQHPRRRRPRIRAPETASQPAPASRAVPRRPLHHAGNPPTPSQLLPDLRPTRARILRSGLLVGGTIAACWMVMRYEGVRGNLGAAPSMVWLSAICAVPVLLFALADALHNRRVRREVQRALAEWPALVRQMCAAEVGGRPPVEVLQERGYRFYEVRRAIVRCLARPAADRR